MKCQLLTRHFRVIISDQNLFPIRVVSARAVRTERVSGCVLHFVSYFRPIPIPDQVQLIKGPSQAHPRNRGNRDSSLIPVISIKNHTRAP